MNISNIATGNIKGVDYCCIISGISKGEAIKSMQNVDLFKKVYTINTKNTLLVTCMI